MSTGQERRERRKIARRAEIRAIAVRLALDIGLEKLTVDAISEAADISPRTFFNYFATKEDALSIEPEASWTAEDVRAEFVERPTDEPPLESMRAVAKSIAVQANLQRQSGDGELLQELYRRHPELFTKAQSEDVDKTRDVLIGELAARGGMDPKRDMYPTLIVATAFIAMQTAVQHSLLNDGKSVEQYIDEAFDSLRNGL